MKNFLKTMMVVAAVASAFGAATLPARALVEIDVNKGNVEPLPIAITDFLSDDGIGVDIAAIVAADLKRSGLFAPIDKGAFIEKISDTNVAPRFEDWKVINAQALVTGRAQPGGRRAAARRVPSVGHFRRRAADRRAVLRQQGQFAPRRPYHRRRHLRAADRRERLFRHAHRVRRRVRAEGQAAEAPRHHGPGWLRRALSLRWQVDRTDTALFTDTPGNHLHVL